MLSPLLLPDIHTVRRRGGARIRFKANVVPRSEVAFPKLASDYLYVCSMCDYYNYAITTLTPLYVRPLNPQIKI